MTPIRHEPRAVSASVMRETNHASMRACTASCFRVTHLYLVRQLLLLLRMQLLLARLQLLQHLRHRCCHCARLHGGVQGCLQLHRLCDGIHCLLSIELLCVLQGIELEGWKLGLGLFRAVLVCMVLLC